MRYLIKKSVGWNKHVGEIFNKKSVGWNKHVGEIFDKEYVGWNRCLIQNHFGSVQIILDGSNWFWLGPNCFGQVQIIKVSPEKKVAKNLFLEEFEWVCVTLLGLKVDP